MSSQNKQTYYVNISKKGYIKKNDNTEKQKGKCTNHTSELANTKDNNTQFYNTTIAEDADKSNGYYEVKID